MVSLAIIMTRNFKGEYDEDYDEDMPAEDEEYEEDELTNDEETEGEDEDNYNQPPHKKQKVGSRILLSFLSLDYFLISRIV